jgi:hypothetical protein
MIRCEVFKQLTRFTYSLETDGEDRTIRFKIYKQLAKFNVRSGEG